MKWKHGFFAIVLLSTGCATTSEDRHLDALFDLKHTDFSRIVSSKEGLTKRGCRLFFPDVDTAECHAEWHRRDLDSKMRYLEERASPTMRGIWEGGRNAGIAEALREGNPKISTAEINAEIAGLGPDLVKECVKSSGMHPDECVFTLGRIATPAEVAAAGPVAAKMEIELARLRGLSMYVLRNQALRMHTVRPPPIRRR